MRSRRIHHAADREVRSNNVAPFASHGILVSMMLRLALRTSRQAGLLRLSTAGVVALVAAWIWLPTYSIAVSILVGLGSLVAILTSWRALLPRRVWEDPLTVGVNRLPTHSRLCNYPTSELAESRGVSPNVASLSGVWKFLLVDNVAAAPAGFEDPDFGDTAWDEIRVPGHWQLQPAGAMDPPIYTNTNYPFPNHPPYAPRSNPTGLYRQNFSLPSEWFYTPERHEDVDLGWQRHERPIRDRLKGCVVLVFQGVDSAFNTWVNGVMVGFAKGSRLPCEFDVTDALTVGEQTLCLRVVRWSDGSYLEDQDHWWLSGVYRDVELALRPAPARISDLVVRPHLNDTDSGNYTQGSIEVEVLVEEDDLTTDVESRALASTPAPRFPRRRRNRSVPSCATVADEGGATVRRLYSEDRLEAGATGVSLVKERRQEALLHDTGERGSDASTCHYEVTCELIDTATGARYLLNESASLPDWQLGQPPENNPRDNKGCRTASRSSFAWRKSCAGVGEEKRAGFDPPNTKTSVRLFRLDVPGVVRTWSAEDPQLYTLIIRLSCTETGDQSGHTRNGPGSRVGESARPHFGRRSYSQFESTRVGFRKVVVRSGQLLVNGKAVMLAGVNRHEHDPDTGKTLSEESMWRDIITMKRFNFNAVRNCHYPNHWRWYELCDELGLYVCDEANIETHGQVPLGRLSADPSWRLAFLDRVWRMVAANKNHACIILWSLGNESGDGDNLLACRRLVKNVEPSRPVVYEGGGRSLVEGCGCTKLTDVVFPMYAGVDATERLGTDGPGGVGETRPCVLCEYSHAMGNSNGNLYKYWQIFRRHRRLQGGFIWDWVDQGLTKYDPVSLQKSWAHGGSFGGSHSRGYDMFCVNGLMFPDRTPHPALWEAKFLAQPVGIDLLAPTLLSDEADDNRSATGICGEAREQRHNKSYSEVPQEEYVSSTPPWESRRGAAVRQGPDQVGCDEEKAFGTRLTHSAETLASSPVLLITNRYDFLSLDHLMAEWWLRSAADPPQSDGTGGPAETRRPLSLQGIAAGQSRKVTVEANLNDSCLPRGVQCEIFLHVEVRLQVDTPWAKEGHVVAWASFPVAPEAFMHGAKQDSGPESSTVQLAGLLEREMISDATEEKVADNVALEPSLSQGLVIYDYDDESLPSREGSPTGQLMEHLISPSPRNPLDCGMIVMKGCLRERGGVGGIPEMGNGGASSSREWRLIVSRVDGSIQRFMADGVDLIEPGAGPSLCLWRAATDNDRAGLPTLMNFVANEKLVSFISNFLPASKLRWEASGLSASNAPVFETQGVRTERCCNHACLIKVTSTVSRCRRRGAHGSRRKGGVLFRVTTEILVDAGGELDVITEMVPVAGAVSAHVSLARVGLTLKVPPGCDYVEWLGRGPFECYQDRKHGAKTDVFSGTVEEQYVPYIHPSENGSKADVRWMALRRGRGGGGILLQAEAGKPFEAASCGIYSSTELQDAQTTADLPLRNSSKDAIFVNVDHRSMGVGGDNSWYPDIVHAEYTVSARNPYRFRVRMVALTPGESGPLVALRQAS